MCGSKNYHCKGIGSVAEVTGCVLGDRIESIDGKRLIDLFCHMYRNTADGAISREALKAIACSVLNGEFRTEGVLYYLNDDSQVCREFYISDSSRKLMADLIGL